MNQVDKTDILANIDFRIYYEQYFSPLRIKKNGWSMPVLCPFHPDKHPSFGVNIQNGACRCLACSFSGDLFSFHMKYHAIDFKRSMEQLGAFVGFDFEDYKPLSKEKIQERKFEQWNHQYVYEWISNKSILLQIMIADAEDILSALFERGSPLPDYFGWIWEKVGQWEKMLCQLEAGQWHWLWAYEYARGYDHEQRIAERLRVKWMELKGVGK